MFCSCILHILDEGPFTFWGCHPLEIYEVPPYWGVWVPLLWRTIRMRFVRLWGATFMRLMRYQPHGTPALGNDTPRDQCSFNSESFVVVTFPFVSPYCAYQGASSCDLSPLHTQKPVPTEGTLCTTVPCNAILCMQDLLECLFCAPLYACFRAISTTTNI